MSYDDLTHTCVNSYSDIFRSLVGSEQILSGEEHNSAMILASNFNGPAQRNPI